MTEKTFKNWDKSEANSLLKRFEEKVCKTQPTKEKIASIIWRLKLQKEKLENTALKLQKRDKEIFEKCVEAEMVKDDARAAIYANECVEIRKMAKIVMFSQLAIEKAILRLQTIEDVGDLLVQMTPVVGIIRETKGKIKGIIPEVAYELEEVNRMLNNTLTETGKVLPEVSVEEEASDEAKKILAEASMLAEQKIEERYPKLPLPPEPTPKTPEQPLEALEALTTPPLSTPKKTITKVSQISEDELKEKVLSYLKQHGGELSIEKCASTLNVTVEDVKKALSLLESEGKIVVQ